MVEQRTFNPWVQGSSPWRPTNGFHGDLGGLAGVTRPTWIFCPPTMIAPRIETRRVTTSGSGQTARSGLVGATGFEPVTPRL
jgi:hypothetical protein